MLRLYELGNWFWRFRFIFYSDLFGVLYFYSIIWKICFKSRIVLIVWEVRLLGVVCFGVCFVNRVEYFFFYYTCRVSLFFFCLFWWGCFVVFLVWSSFFIFVIFFDNWKYFGGFGRRLDGGGVKGFFFCF